MPSRRRDPGASSTKCSRGVALIPKTCSSRPWKNVVSITYGGRPLNSVASRDENGVSSARNGCDPGHVSGRWKHLDYRAPPPPPKPPPRPPSLPPPAHHLCSPPSNPSPWPPPP